jgi:hypothetical protein
MIKRRAGRLPRWQESSVYVTFGLLLTTGIAWLLLDKFVQVAGEFGPEHHPAEHILLIVHGVVAYAFLVVCGAMIPVHIALGWNTRRNLKSGVLFVAVLLLLTATALGLYYLGDDVLRPRVNLIHWTAGLVALPLLVIHALGGRRGALPFRSSAKRPHKAT